MWGGGWRRAALALAALAGAWLLATAPLEQTHYAMLGVAPDADMPSIKKAYRARAFVLHPDKTKEQHWIQQWWGGDASHRFSRLAEAYECLDDAPCRQRYDQELLLAKTAGHDQQHWSQRWRAQHDAHARQLSRAWAAAGSPREMGLYAVASVQQLVTALPSWLPTLLTPRGLVRVAVTILILTLSIEIVARPLWSVMVWLLMAPWRTVALVWGELSGSRSCRDKRREEELQAARAAMVAANTQRLQHDTALETRRRREVEDLKTLVGRFASATGSSSASAGAGLLVKVIDNILLHPDDMRYRRLKTTNKALGSQLLRLAEGRALVYGLGFIPDEADEYNHLVLCAGEAGDDPLSREYNTQIQVLGYSFSFLAVCMVLCGAGTQV